MRGSLLKCRVLGVLDLIAHTLRLDRFGWCYVICDAYDNACRRYWNGR